MKIYFYNERVDCLISLQKIGPLLFLLFINDIDHNIKSPLRLFVDYDILYRQIWSKDDHNIIQNDIQTRC